jgi:hypothetical protein
MRYFFLIAVILARFTAFGQPIERFNVPDFALVEKETHDANGAYYYPRLMNRYRNDDTLLKLKDFYMLYYGVFSAPDSREMAIDLSDLYDTVRAINGKDSVTERDRTALLGSYLKLSENSPFELRYLNAIYNLYEYRHDPAAEYYRFRLRMILEVITETGDGKTRESGFYVNSVSDE